ncbi:MAG TPA: radical SAM-associated putative lipoprotein [Spirochaetota bacterium]|nr:radical SAM-associated putative lipoprotein [Spirochaetota bacterium]HOS33325.1 radical SAM-associated putative lipoprotein [Spirochaetota bacterium]HOS56538.1 radical SAM-associated putative lipoprotein [Spirochaetota bacterium]HPK61378.1 radical SAM-associated putative lipoprotein [Spirochaetota bacterium]HQF78475.1 radical SAM-associated putative lipoprotein [Spirochaetota bacterium]
MAKAVKTRFLRIFSTILGGILSLFGISAYCMPAEYGTPTAEYTFKGKVTSSLTGKPIPGVKVTVDSTSAYDYSAYIKSIITDESGDYEILKDYGGAPDGKVIYIRAKDVDGELNGNFKDVEKSHTIKKTDFSGGDGKWNEGSATATINIQMEPL